MARSRLALAGLCLLLVLIVDAYAQIQPSGWGQRKEDQVSTSSKKHGHTGGKCKAGRHGLACSECPKGYYTTDGKHCQRCSNFRTTGDCEDGLCTGPEACTELGCPVGTFKAPTSSECEPCPVGQWSEGGYPYPKKCHRCPDGTATLGKGSYSSDQCVSLECPAGTGRVPGGVDCEPCEIGFWSKQGQDVCSACPDGSTTLQKGTKSAATCVCAAGYEPSAEGGDGEPQCTACVEGAFKSEVGDQQCELCPWPKTTKTTGSTSSSQCVCAAKGGKGANCDECPGELIMLEDATCGCPPGTGGASCTECKRGFFSTGGRPGKPFAKCKSCGPHFTSPAGSPSAEFCECVTGFGADPEDEESCVPCPLGTFNPGTPKSSSSQGGAAYIASVTDAQKRKAQAASGSRRAAQHPLATPCQQCGAAYPDGQFTTAQLGSTAASDCQCLPGHGGLSCAACSAGTFSEGGPSAVCHSCPSAIYTTVPETAATSAASCVCLAGYGVTASGACELCPHNTYSPGGKQACVPCAFGTTSKAGASSESQCQPVSHECPGLGQVAPPGAVSSEQCGCYPGFGGGNSPSDPCTICPVGTWSRGGDLEACVPCRFGFTSGKGSTSPRDCYPVDQCPAGTDVVDRDRASSTLECRCKPGYGSSTGAAPCRVCPSGTWSSGGSYEDCQPCPWSTTSPTGATSRGECKASPQACPIGQWAPEDAVSREQCVCYPGFGAGESPSDPCTICPVGTWSPGKTLDRCLPCEFGTTSAAGSTSSRDCYPTKQCPPGTRVPTNMFRQGYASSAQECRCKAGYGSPTGSGICTECPEGTYSPGATYEDCKPCPYGYTSRPGAQGESECRPVAAKCPVGMIAPVDAVSSRECACLPGHGASDGPGAASCHLCPAGSWSPGGSVQQCVPCRFGFSSAAGATSEAQCFPVNACPPGTEPHRALRRQPTLADCVCKEGHGLVPDTGVCRLCPRGTFSQGGTMEDCKPCPFGFTSDDGATSKSECRKEAQRCPIGQWAPHDAVSSKECSCLAGFGAGESPSDPCTICPPGSFSEGKGLEKCMPCGFGFTSLEGASSEKDCYPSHAACPAGTATRDGDIPSGPSECKCKQGYGSPTGTAPCHLCPMGTWSSGGSYEDCQPCGFGLTSREGAASKSECVPSARGPCPVGQAAPPHAVSEEECACLPGFGGGRHPSDACKICAPGWWAPGGNTRPCMPCSGPARAYTGPPGATSPAQCREVDEEDYDRSYRHAAAANTQRWVQGEAPPAKIGKPTAGATILQQAKAMSTDYRGSASSLLQRLNHQANIIQQAEYRSDASAAPNAKPQPGEPDLAAIVNNVVQAYQPKAAANSTTAPAAKPEAALPKVQPEEMPAPAAAGAGPAHKDTAPAGTTPEKPQQQQQQPAAAAGAGNVPNATAAPQEPPTVPAQPASASSNSSTQQQQPVSGPQAVGASQPGSPPAAATNSSSHSLAAS